MFATLRNLPRDSRDTLFLLLVIAWLILPQVANLPWWCSSSAALVLLWRGRLALRSAPLPTRGWLAVLLLLACDATYVQYGSLLGRDAGVAFVVVLLSLKTLEMHARRDTFVLFFLGFFTLLSNFFFSQSLPVAAAMLIGMLGLLTALVLSHMPVGKPPLRLAAASALWMALAGAPIMVTLFLLFPRIAPLWGLPADAMQGRSGLSATMPVGAIAELALDDSVAFRLHFEGPAPEQRDLYFRGPVLAHFDGQSWTPLQPHLPRQLQPQAELTVSGPPVRYQVTLEPLGQPWLLLLDATPEAPQLSAFNPHMEDDLQWQVERPITELLRYRAQSYPQFRHGPLQRVAGLQEYLQLPNGYNPRTLQLAQELRRQNASAAPFALVLAALQRLRSGGYRYTLDPGVSGRDSADTFWFDSKEGFCEHIASSFAILVRAMGIPARIVTGYQGGERNAVDGDWTVRQSDAHAWTEVWIAGQGWVRVDPTGAVQPGRIGSLARLQAPHNAVVQALDAVNPRFMLDLRAVWEAANNGWNQWVLNYSESRQMNLLRHLGFAEPDWEDLGYLLAALLLTASLVGAAWTQWERRHLDPWLRLLQGARRRLRAAGLASAPQATPRQLAQALPADARFDAVRDWLLRLEAARYSPAADASGLATLRRDLRHLPWPHPLPPTPP